MDAKLMFIGEAPGPTEERRGYPFAGVSGSVARGIIKSSGLHDERDVRWNNVIPWNPGSLPSAVAARKKIVEQAWTNLDADLQLCKAKVVVACGWAALYRLTGKAVPIIDWNGAVIPTDGRLVIPCVHPASIMRTKTQIGRLAVDRAIRRACRYASGALRYAPRTVEIKTPCAAELDSVLTKATRVAIDTEFSRETQVPFLIGLAVDDKAVYHLRPNVPGVMEVLGKHLVRRDLLKIAQMYTADIVSMSRLGLDTRGPWFCTLLAFNTLYPGLKVGLENVAQFMLDDVQNWKWMEGDDPAYNALDVSITWRLYEPLMRGLVQEGLIKVFEEEVMAVAPFAWGLEVRGIQVDPARNEQLVEWHEEQASTLRRRVINEVGAVFERRGDEVRAELAEVNERVATIRRSVQAVTFKCPVKGHEAYDGLRKKRWAKGEACTCVEIYERAEPVRTSLKEVQASVTKLKAKLKRWDRDFDPGNNHDLRWLLYDEHALALPVQKHEGAVTANADAVARLISLAVVKKRGLVELLAQIKQYQHVTKMLSTFLKPPVDADGVSHPPYRIHGTETGRPASGDEEAMGDKSVSPWAFNALNQPEEVRAQFVPRGG